MTHSFKLSRRIARLRVPVFAAILLTAIGCNETDSFNPDSSSPAGPTDQTPGTAVEVTADEGYAPNSFAGGIPFGTWRLPTEQYGTRFNGAVLIASRTNVMKQLAAIKARGGRVALNLAGGKQANFKDSKGHFSLSMWQDRVAHYRGLDFSSYVKDGTIIGHYLIDEPNDKANFGGVPVSPATIEAMAKFSKQLWPSMPTIARTWPAYLAEYNGKFQYLDAAWALYHAARFPNARAFIAENVQKAQAKGLALVVGLNIIDGSPSKGNMSASQLKEYGSALLSSSYPCAFISWQYRDSYMAPSSIKDAMSDLRRQAQNRGSKSCRAS
jgi:hypothetical protein